jgi:hypothetical protein
LYIFNTITAKSLQWITTNVWEKSPSWEAYSCSATHSNPCLYRTCKFITIFATAWLTPSHLISSAHLSSVLTHIPHWTTLLLWPICLVHFERVADTPKWGTKKVRHWQTAEPWPIIPFLKQHKKHTMKRKTQSSQTAT